MTKEDLAKALSLSCVENYFLAFFKDKLDISQLYVESFVPFNKVINDFIVDGVSYENYPLIRAQDTAEKLGFSTHKLCNDLKFEEHSLNLIRINESFFENSKLTPWRADHFIAVKKSTDGISFFNNYPLTCGSLTKDRFNDVYDNACLVYTFTNKCDCEKYSNFSDLQFNSIKHSCVENFTLLKENVLQLRNAILVLKTLRKRLIKWFEYMSESGEFIIDVNFGILANGLISCYEKLFIKLELQLTRDKIDIEILQDKLNELMFLENELTKEVIWRRLENEHI